MIHAFFTRAEGMTQIGPHASRASVRGWITIFLYQLSRDVVDQHPGIRPADIPTMLARISAPARSHTDSPYP